MREAFTQLATRIRARTRLPLEPAHNCTVTERNLDSIAEIVRWFLSDPARSRVWRILSFQPEANTGRTIFSRNPVTPEMVWEKLLRGNGIANRPKPIPRRAPGLQPWNHLDDRATPRPLPATIA